MTAPIKALCEKALAEFKHDPHAHYVEELVRECMKLLEANEEMQKSLIKILSYCPDESHCEDSKQIESDKCVIYEHKVAREALAKCDQTTNGEPK